MTLTYIFCLDLWPHVNTNYTMFPDCPLEQAMEADTGWWVWHLRWLRHRQWPWPRFHLDLWPQGEEIPHGSFHIEGAPAQWGLQHGQIWGLYRYKGERIIHVLIIYMYIHTSEKWSGITQPQVNSWKCYTVYPRFNSPTLINAPFRSQNLFFSKQKLTK